jgi:UDP-glucose 4-epimerase
MKKCLVTGGAGFIGSNLTRKLVAENYSVVVLDDLSTGSLDNLKDLLGKIEFVKADIRDEEKVKAVMKGVSYVFHLAALPSVTRSMEDPLTTNSINIKGTLVLLKTAAEYGVEKFIYSSSSSIYGDNPQMPQVEESVSHPISPYGVSKKAGEDYAYVFYKSFQLKTVSLRYFNVFGPYQSDTSEYAAVIPRFISLVLQGRKPTIYGDGFQSRDFTYVENVVLANLLAVSSEKANGEIINVAMGESINLNQMIEIFSEILEKKIEPIYTDPRPGDIKHSCADLTRAKKLLNYTPKISFKEGLKMTIEWFRGRK